MNEFFNKIKIKIVVPTKENSSNEEKTTKEIAEIYENQFNNLVYEIFRFAKEQDLNIDVDINTEDLGANTCEDLQIRWHANTEGCVMHTCWKPSSCY